MKNKGDRKFRLNGNTILTLAGAAVYLFFFLGFMIRPCINTLTSIFTAVPDDPLAVVKFFLSGNMKEYVWNSFKLAIALVITVNFVGISIVLLTEYFDI